MAHIEEFLNSYEPDILCLQETKTVDEKFPRDIFIDRGYEVEIYGEKSYNGVAIVSKLPITTITKGFNEEIAAGSRRLVATTCGDVKVLNVYIPNGQAVGSDKYSYKLEWLVALKKHIEANYSPDDDLIICGDFNIAPDDRDIYNPEQYAGRIMCSDVEREHLEDIRKWGFVDVFRQQHEESGLFSWWDYQAGSFRRNIGFRIDHIWTTASLVPKCSATMIAREMREMQKPSDHAPVMAEFDL